MKSVQEKNGFRVIRRGSVDLSPSPLDCPLCLCVVLDEIDITSIERTGCCFDCESEVADPNRSRWLEGWRPDKLEISEIMSRRLSSPHSRRHI